jgi:hypothetical protein
VALDPRGLPRGSPLLKLSGSLFERDDSLELPVTDDASSSSRNRCHAAGSSFSQARSTSSVSCERQTSA